jgi:hypothetical protein
MMKSFSKVRMKSAWQSPIEANIRYHRTRLLRRSPAGELPRNDKNASVVASGAKQSLRCAIDGVTTAEDYRIARLHQRSTEMTQQYFLAIVGDFNYSNVFKMTWRRRADSDRCIGVLQTPALPLGYVASPDKKKEDKKILSSIPCILT